MGASGKQCVLPESKVFHRHLSPVVGERCSSWQGAGVERGVRSHYLCLTQCWERCSLQLQRSAQTQPRGHCPECTEECGKSAQLCGEGGGRESEGAVALSAAACEISGPSYH